MSDKQELELSLQAKMAEIETLKDKCFEMEEEQHILQVGSTRFFFRPPCTADEFCLYNTPVKWSRKVLSWYLSIYIYATIYIYK